MVNGKHHNKHGSTYASTPSREEFLILMHLFSVFDGDFYRIDENRAFLNVPKLDQIKTFLVILLTMRYKMRYPDSRHQAMIIKRKMLCVWTSISLPVFTSVVRSTTNSKMASKLCIVYAHVDDFLFGGTDKTYTQQQIIDFRKLASTSEPAMNPASVLGYEIERDRERKLIKVINKAKINEVATLFPHATKRKRNVPIPTTGYLVHDSDFDHIPATESAFLTKPDITLYMQLVGVFVWIQGVRPMSYSPSYI